MKNTTEKLIRIKEIVEKIAPFYDHLSWEFIDYFEEDHEECNPLLKELQKIVKEI